MRCSILLSVLIICLPSWSLFAQTGPTIAEIKANTADYYWGEATSSDAKEAQDLALAMLIEKIQVTVSASFENITNEARSQDESSFLETTRSYVRSYSKQTLRDLETIQQLTDANKLYVFRYISKQAVQALFKEREKLVHTLFDEGEYAAKQFNYKYALMRYYNALILMNSIPMQLQPYKGDVLSVEIPKRINALMEAIDIRFDSERMISDKEREIVLEMRALGQPLKQLSFTFWTGNKFVDAEAKDGYASIRLLGASVDFDELICRPTYSFYSSRNQLDALATVWDATVNKPEFTRAIKVLLTAAKKQESSPITADALVLNTAEELELEDQVQQQLKETMALFWQNTLPANHPKVAESFHAKWSEIQKFNNVSFSTIKKTPKILPTWSDLEVREIPVINVYRTLDLQTTEYLIPDASVEGQLYDVNFGILKDLYEEIKQQSLYGEDWKERHVLIKFLEKYRTAFLTRDLDTINEIFSDEARIIVGRKIRPGESGGANYKYVPEGKNQPSYRYVELKKKEYLNNLKSLFSRVPDIYAGYTSFQILRKNNTPGVYGVSMRQDYQSTGYADEGYLFLLIDFNHDQPQIMVRSWQPQEWREDALIELSDFKVYK